ncbi:MAG: CDP-glycerol glycerophosphotransferase family protein [Megasphaera sp.]|uniref:CDP-glycerol glycerophosphotransferase family protein n=1 Tax=Megasphaera sp. TaxID=2023260 RepID=UPI003EFF9A72
MDMKTILQKVKQKGVRGTCRAVVRRVLAVPNKAFLWWYQRHCPIQQNLILLESDGDLMDNGYALFDYMNRQGYLKKYHVIWMVSDVEKASKHQFPNTEYLPKFPQYFNRRWAKALATCHWNVYDHNNVMNWVKKREGQEIIYLSHGIGYKKIKPNETKRCMDKCRTDYMTVPGKIGADYLSDFTGEPLEKMLITGYPRNDYFFQQNDKTKKLINENWHFNHYRKVVFWMPTFRQSNQAQLSENYIHNETGLPLFESMNELEEFSHFLKQYNVLFVLKLHPYQAELHVFKRNYANILVLRNEDIEALGLQLYQVVPLSDVLITDYSSIATDYLLLDKPIIFTLDDYKEYEASRGGLYPENAKDYMSGYHVYTKDELEKALCEIIDEKDRYVDFRHKILPQYNTYIDGNSAQRILDAIGIRK